MLPYKRSPEESCSLGDATGPSEGHSVCSCRAGNNVSTVEQQQFPVGHHVRMRRGENRQIILIFPIWKKCLRPSRVDTVVRKLISEILKTAYAQ